VGIVLLEFPNSGKTRKRARGFVAMQNAEIGNTHRQLTVTTFTVAKENKVTRAVHRLQGPLGLVIRLNPEHIVLVMSPVTRGLPDANIVHVRGLDLLVAALAVLSTQKGLKLVENLGSVGEEERRPGRHIIKEEQLLFLSNSQVVTSLSLFQELQVLRH
jgi:hypothetical protein